MALDGKGRLAMPARYRKALAELSGDQLTITRHPEGCLLIYPKPAWEQFAQRVAALPANAQWWKRLYFGAAQETALDGSGRVLVSPELRQAAGLVKDVALLGLGEYFELWDRSVYQNREPQGLQQPSSQLPADFRY